MNASERMAMDDMSRAPGFCASLPWYRGARTFVEVLKDFGNVWAVTAPWNSSTWDSERRAWLAPVLNPSKVISCNTLAKPLVRGDVLIEDRTATLVAWLAENPKGLGILLDRPWNRNDRIPSGCVRANDYADAAREIRIHSRQVAA